MDIVVATNNKGKLRELGEMLTGFNVLSQQEVGADIDVEETGTTYEENALLKARAVRKYTNKYIIADDSGLEVDVLDGAPGLYSARYAGEGTTSDQGMDKLLENLKSYAPEEKTAHFISCIVLIEPDGTQRAFYGRCDGFITDKKIGDGGFGFDPIFFFPEYKKTFAQLTADEKNAVSHRRKALASLKEYLDTIEK
ncbi:MAG: XTP/dITP diphosphatase [Clostridia bacterium]|nr:XTP/dITP diphosphatase [Clostridia bacterium]